MSRDGIVKAERRLLYPTLSLRHIVCRRKRTGALPAHPSIPTYKNRVKKKGRAEAERRLILLLLLSSLRLAYTVCKRKGKGALPAYPSIPSHKKKVKKKREGGRAEADVALFYSCYTLRFANRTQSLNAKGGGPYPSYP